MRCNSGCGHAPGGLDAAGILAAAAAGEIDLLVLLGADPLADFPDAALAAQAIDRAGVVVALDSFLTASAARADVVLPASMFAEKSGTTTNLEGRVTTVAQRVTAAGTSRADWMVAAELADLLALRRPGDDAAVGDVDHRRHRRHGARLRRGDHVGRGR